MDYESIRRGSTPRRAITSTPEPDGEAAACKAVEAGSTPTGVSLSGEPPLPTFTIKDIDIAGPAARSILTR